MISRKLELPFYLILALAAHGLMASAVIFTFPVTAIKAKPSLVFLGAFLRPEDFLSLSDDHSIRAQDYEGNLNLDVRQGSLSRGFNKPNFEEHVGSMTKSQYKPVMVQGTEIRKTGPKDDLGIDLSPFPPVRMKIEQEHDQD